MEKPHAVEVQRAEQASPDMGTAALTRLERIARNLPATRMDLGKAEAPFGTVYLAWGRDPEMRWHGVWGLRGMARICGFGPSYTAKDVQQLMVDDAAAFYQMADKRNMWDEGFWRAGHS